ncbi:hypothetical protein ETAA8_65340 [Anatilimnocola aggregata]|uniref:Uncharacterized protein n=1 Tax=Anatilimnocola aggregata TaxID=2528021 RepID=A0A517YMC5_9BACT|nr:hypothetical protein [Anatilimnocola aggregata]QDU31377.1 hypothetical protein ETAA8_65340 [Anatilimnocola aggregata]
MFRFLLTVVVLWLAIPLAAFAQTGDAAPKKPEARMPIGRTHGMSGGTLQSNHEKSDGTRVLHGLQVVYGPRLQIKEYSVFNLGRCEQLVQIHPNGNSFRMQWREHNGDGHEALYASGADTMIAEKVIVDGGKDIGPIKVPERICLGWVRAGKCYSGTFLMREVQGFQFVLRLHEYKEGKLVNSKPFPFERFGIPVAEATEEKWRWSFPEWPQAGKE